MKSGPALLASHLGMGLKPPNRRRPIEFIIYISFYIEVNLSPNPKY